MKRSGQLFRHLRNHAVVWASMILPTVEEFFDLPDPAPAPASTRIGLFDTMSRWAWRRRIVTVRLVILAGVAWLGAALLGVSFLEAALVVLFVWWLAAMVLAEVWLRRPPRSDGSGHRRRPRGGDDDSGGAPVFAKLPPGPHGPLVGAAAKVLPSAEEDR